MCAILVFLEFLPLPLSSPSDRDVAQLQAHRALMAVLQQKGEIPRSHILYPKEGSKSPLCRSFPRVLCLKGGYEYGFQKRTPEELLKYEAERRELLDRLRAEAKLEQEREALNLPLDRFLRKEYADLDDNVTFSEKLTALMQNETCDGDPLPEQLLDAEDRGSSLEEEDHTFVRVGEEIDPLYDCEYREAQEEARRRGDPPIPDRKYRVAYMTPAGRLVCEDVSDLNQFIKQRVEYRRKWKAEGGKPPPPPWELDEEAAVQTLMKEVLAARAERVALGLPPTQDPFDDNFELPRVPIVEVDEPPESVVLRDATERIFRRVSFEEKDWAGMVKLLSGRGRRKIRDRKVVEVVEHYGFNVTCWEDDVTEPIFESNSTILAKYADGIDDIATKVFVEQAEEDLPSVAEAKHCVPEMPPDHPEILYADGKFILDEYEEAGSDEEEKAKWNLTEAMELLEAAVAKDPKHHLAYTYMGRCVFEMTGDVDKAEQLLQKALQLQPQHITTLVTLSEIMLKANTSTPNETYTSKFEEAEQRFEDIAMAMNTSTMWNEFLECQSEAVNMSEAAMREFLKPLPGSLEELASPRVTVEHYVHVVENMEELFPYLEDDPFGRELLQMLAQGAPEEFKEKILMNRKHAWVWAKQNGEEIPEGCEEWDEERERERLRHPAREEVYIYISIYH